MGVTVGREPDYRKVAKNMVTVDKPCVAELSALMECMKRAADADSRCDTERAALQACSRKMGATSVRAARNNMYVHMLRLARTWKKFGY
ncbi:hypothetical protein FOA52_015777 [Chlamydomonas sp. UWO 241]|nr:hypothetical protein FOA52_015777 [Chlamydomonas sp. UWO 241]